MFPENSCSFTALSPPLQQQVWLFKKERKTETQHLGVLSGDVLFCSETDGFFQINLPLSPWAVVSSTSIIVKWAEPTPLRHCLGACWAHSALWESVIAVTKRTSRNREVGRCVVHIWTDDKFARCCKLDKRKTSISNGSA